MTKWGNSFQMRSGFQAPCATLPQTPCFKQVSVNAAKKSNRGIFILAGISVTMMGIAAFLPKLGFGPASGPSPGTLIVNNLRQFDGAIQVWAFDHGVTNVTAEPRWDDLLPYLLHRQKPKPEAGEQYVPGRLCDGPYAMLTRKYLNYPKGTIIRLRKDGTVEFESGIQNPIRENS
jgi:hypothetical protein